MFDLADPFDSLVLENITAQAVDSVRGLNDDTAIQQRFHNGLYISGLGIIRMEMEKHVGNITKTGQCTSRNFVKQALTI